MKLIDSNLDRFKETSKLCLILGDVDIFRYGTEDNRFNSDYKCDLREKLDAIKSEGNSSSIAALWRETENFEMNNNFQRFYLFKEVADDLKFDNQLKVNLILEWIKFSPPKPNISWNAFNCSVRLINWVKILISVSDDYEISKEDFYTISNSIYKHIQIIRQNIEYHIPGNHVLIQYFSIFFTLTLFDNWDFSEKLNEIFEKNFIEEFEKEFPNRQFHFEHSSHYHIQIILIGIYYYIISKKKMGKIPANIVKERLLDISELMTFFKIGDDRLVMLGDNCYPFFHDSLKNDYQNVFALFKYLEFDLNNSTNKVIIRDPYIFCAKGNSKLIYDVGLIGLEQNPGHGHADIQSVIFSDNDKPIFIDPGTRNYSNKKDDIHVKKTISHNTLSIDGEDQALNWGFFRWAYLPTRPVFKIEDFNDSLVIKSSFHGFKHLGGITHSRNIELMEGKLSITDSVPNLIDKNVELNFILNPEIICKTDDNCMIFNLNDLKWKLEVGSAIPHRFNISEISIYPEYDFPVHSNKVQILFESFTGDFHSQINFQRIL
ncbi:MAG: heparinase II/III family protein [Melioribacteraceae bacterium]|nr:heparinase II/III family protein [Melioribacteraceae bacterium]